MKPLKLERSVEVARSAADERGIPLRSLLIHRVGLFPDYDHVEVISADGFGTRIYRAE